MDPSHNDIFEKTISAILNDNLLQIKYFREEIFKNQNKTSLPLRLISNGTIFSNCIDHNIFAEGLLQVNTLGPKETALLM